MVHWGRRSYKRKNRRGRRKSMKGRRKSRRNSRRVVYNRWSDNEGVTITPQYLFGRGRGSFSKRRKRTPPYNEFGFFPFFSRRRNMRRGSRRKMHRGSRRKMRRGSRRKRTRRSSVHRSFGMSPSQRLIQFGYGRPASGCRFGRTAGSGLGGMGPGYKGATSFQENKGAYYYGAKEPFVLASEWWYPGGPSPALAGSGVATNYQIPQLYKY